MGWWAMSKQIIPNVMYHYQTTELYQQLSMEIKEPGKGKQTAISWMYSTYPCILLKYSRSLHISLKYT